MVSWHTFTAPTLTDIARQWLATLREPPHRWLDVTPSMALRLRNDEIWAIFAGLAHHRGQASSGSPVALERNGDWIQRADTCFLNIRALGKGNKPGTISDALKVLPTLSAQAIHLAPFFDCSLDNVYAIDSHSMVNWQLVCPDLAAEGLGADTQLQLLIEAIHLLDMAVGFDWEPHTSQFSRVALADPTLFRWIALGEPAAGETIDRGLIRRPLRHRLSMAGMVQPESQARLHEEVSQLVGEVLVEHRLTHVEDRRLGDDVVRQAASDAGQRLRDRGLWTIPSHTWDGAGLPEYVGIHPEGYPEFVYRNRDGEHHRHHAFGVLSPIRTVDGLAINKLTDPAHLQPFEPGLAALAEIYPRLIQRFDLDFIRLDFVDHVFDSVYANGEPYSDRPYPELLRRVILRAREVRPWTGVIAERMGYDVDHYGGIGVNTVLGTDMQLDMTVTHIQALEEVSAWLKQHDLCTAFHCIDTHDTANPLLFGATPYERYGREGMLRRQFWALFANFGAKRPRYEVIGNRDGAVGLYSANNAAVNLTFNDDRVLMLGMLHLEQLAKELAPSLADRDWQLLSTRDQLAVWRCGSQGDASVFWSLLEPEPDTDQPITFQPRSVPLNPPDDGEGWQPLMRGVLGDPPEWRAESKELFFSESTLSGTFGVFNLAWIADDPHEELP